MRLVALYNYWMDDRVAAGAMRYSLPGSRDPANHLRVSRPGP